MHRTPQSEEIKSVVLDIPPVSPWQYFGEDVALSMGASQSTHITSPGPHDNGGPYGEQRGGDVTAEQPPEWMRWWAAEQARMMSSMMKQQTAAMERMVGACNGGMPKMKITKMTAEDDPEAYLRTFERVAQVAGWPREKWATILTPHLTGPVQRAVDALTPEEASDYEEIKRTILGTLNVSGETYRRRLREIKWEPKMTSRDLTNLIKNSGTRWLKPKERSKEELMELILVEQFLKALPPKACAWVMCQQPVDLEGAAQALEIFLAAEKEGREAAGGTPKEGARGAKGYALGGAQGSGERSGNAWRGGDGRSSTMASKESGRARTEGGARPRGVEQLGREPREDGRRCFACGAFGHLRRDCPERRGQRVVAWGSPQVKVPAAPVVRVRVAGEVGEALLDSGCAQTLVRVAPRGKVDDTTWIRCVHGDVRPYKRAEMTLEVEGRRVKTLVGMAPGLKYLAIIGRDFPGFQSLLGRYQTTSTGGAVVEASAGVEEPWESEDTVKAQEEDPTLREAWRQAREEQGEARQGVYFEIEKGKLYRRGKGPLGESIDQLVLPKVMRGEAMALAHDTLLGGHMGVKATLSRLVTRFYWPGIREEVKRFCESCEQCQRTQAKGGPGGELQPTPIIEVPFKRVAMDIIGPLPKGRGGFEYALVLIDYATRYPEAVPLRNTKAKTLAQELVKVFSRVGFPEEVLTDQGQNFIGKVMQEMWGQLGVKPLKTSVYHPQANGLVERFNQTLKRMISKFAILDPKGWPQTLEPLLFAVREVPQASTGISPFELLFGRKPRGILDLARRQWGGEEPQGVGQGPLHVGQLRERLGQLARWARARLAEAQAGQKERFDSKVRVREFDVGDKVLLLLPTSEKKLIAQWQGPYEVCQKLGVLNYRLKDEKGQELKRTYHVNLLKRWIVREQEGMAGEGEEEELGPSAAEAGKAAGELVLGEGLLPDQVKQVQAVREKRRRVFSNLPGRTHLVQHKIDTKPGAVVRLAPRKWPKKLEDQLRQEVREMLRMGVIEPSQSEWRSYPVMVPKGDGTIRVCIDFRKVNEVSRFDAYPMPRVLGLLERLGKARYLSTIDLTKGYWQIPLEEKSKEVTAFATPQGLYQFVRMPFGLHGAAATFQRLVDKLLAGRESYAAAYIDDIIIFSDDWNQHVHHLDQVFGALEEAGLTANPAKCKIGMTQTQFLGFQVGGGKIRPVRGKVEAIQRIQPPQSKREVQRLLGMIGYYRMFIPQFSRIAAPLTDLTKGKRGQKIDWTPECQEALEKLKEALSTPPVLIAPDFCKPFIVHTDASGRGLGAVLSQGTPEGEKPVLFLSRKLTKAEQNYSTVEREALAVKWAVNTLRYYLLGAPFKLVTDHAPLVWLQRMKDSNARLTRWYLSLQPYAFEVEHRKGALHTNADFLSRQVEDAPWRTGEVAPVLPGGECGKRKMTPQEELEEDLMWLDISREEGDPECHCGSATRIIHPPIPPWERERREKEAEALEAHTMTPEEWKAMLERDERMEEQRKLMIAGYWRRRKEQAYRHPGGLSSSCSLRRPGMDQGPAWWWNQPPPPRSEGWKLPRGRGPWRDT